MTKRITVLVGPPCSGKSSYLKDFESDFVISSDRIVEILCRQHMLEYHEYFLLPKLHKIRIAHDKIFYKLVQHSKRFQHIVWDLTNLTQESRARIFVHYPGASFTAIQFDTPCGKNEVLKRELLQRNLERSRTQGKYIEESILKSMVDKYERVNEDEGFNEILNLKVINITNK